MNLIYKCPVCKSDNVNFEPGYLAQFVLWRIYKTYVNNHHLIPILRCNDCSFLCTAARFTAEETANLYNDYRGYEYNQLRVHCEPSYQHLVGKFTTQEEIQRRLVGINTLIQRHIDPSTIKTLLDFGGGSGHFIPSNIDTTEKYVFDISMNPLVQNIKRFDGSCEKKFDFIMCCHVLEHVSEPKVVMKEIMHYGHIDTKYYFEVPEFDAPPMPNGIWHEHINSFNETSFKKLLATSNLDIIDMIKFNGNMGYLTIKTIE
jgi:hypothetical protein